jgi:hypothetical protein
MTTKTDTMQVDTFSGELKLTFFVAAVFFTLAACAAVINFAISSRRAEPVQEAGVQ